MENDIFKVSEELQKKFEEKFPLHVIKEYFYNPETRIVKINSHEIRIISKIFEYSLISKEDIKTKIALLCERLKEICNKYNIPYRTIDILLVSDKDDDETLPRPLNKNFKLDDGIERGLIYIPRINFKFKQCCLFYNFLHELGDRWITIHFQISEAEENFSDLIAMSALKPIVDWQKCKNDIGMVSYLGDMIREKKRSFYTQDMLDDPEKYLKEISEELNL